MKINQRLPLSFLLLVIIGAGIACGGFQPTADTPPPATPTPTEAFIPPVEPIPGWSRFVGREIEVWLPESYFGGDPLRDLSLLKQYLGQYGEQGQFHISELEQRYAQINFFAFNTVPEADGTIITMDISTEIIPPGITMDGYLDEVMEIVLQNHTLVSREVGSINGLETGRMVLDFMMGDKPGRKVVYILRESQSKVWGLTYSASAEVFDANAENFHQSVRAFRSTAMVAQQAAVAAPGGAGATSTPEGLLKYDDFSNDQSGWDSFNNDQISRYYSEGSYHFFFFQEDLVAATAIGESLSSARVEVDAWMADPTDPAAYGEMGIVCGFVDANNYYFLSIRTDGYFGVFKKQGEDIHFVGLQDWVQSAAIKTGSAPNRLAAECTGTVLRLYVNGALLAEVQTAEPVSGKVGLYGGSFDWRDTHIQFDNFLVTRQ